MAEERNPRFISAYSKDEFEAIMAENERAETITARRSGEGAPTSATVGAVGDLYTETLCGKLYHCVDDTPGAYVWEEIVEALTDAEIEAAWNAWG